MVSEIKSSGTPGTGAVDTAIRKISNAPANAAAASTTASTEVVTLTDLAARLQKLTESVQDLPIVDQARVSEFRDQIANGAYTMDEHQIADKLASFEALLGRVSHG